MDAQVLVLSHSLWQRQFGGDRARSRASHHGRGADLHRHRRDRAGLPIAARKAGCLRADSRLLSAGGEIARRASHAGLCAAAAGRDHRGSAERIAGHRSADGGGESGREQATQQPARFPARTHGRRYPARLARAFWRGRPAPAHRVRELRQPAARAHGNAAARADDSRGAGRIARAIDRANVDRKRAPRGARGRGWFAPGQLGRGCVARFETGRFAARGKYLARCAGAVLHLRARARHRDRLWHSARLAGDPGGSERRRGRGRRAASPRRARGCAARWSWPN